MAKLHIGNRASLFCLLSCFDPHHCRGATAKKQKEHEREWDEGRKSGDHDHNDRREGAGSLDLLGHKFDRECLQCGPSPRQHHEDLLSQDSEQYRWMRTSDGCGGEVGLLP